MQCLPSQVASLYNKTKKGWESKTFHSSCYSKLSVTVVQEGFFPTLLK